MRFHDLFLEMTMPQNTRRRRVYELGFRGCNILVNQGPHSFCCSAREFLRSIRYKQADYEIWIQNNEPKDQGTYQNFSYLPKISIITPVWNTREDLLRAAIDSVLDQTYDNWELCIADGGSEEPHVSMVLDEYALSDDRIKVRFLERNRGIAENTNEALSLATGDFIALMDHDDALAPFALNEVVRLLNHNPDLKFVYSDEDKIDQSGRRFDPFFKPEWSPDLLLSCGYTNHLGVYRRDIVEKIGRFRSSFEGSQDYDMLLRFVDAIEDDEIGHLPEILYHWRQISGSTALDPNAKNGIVISAAKRALKDTMDRKHIQAAVLDGLWLSSYRVKREILGEPKVSIIVPTKNMLSALKKCIGSIEERTSYGNYEIIVVDNNSDDAEVLDYLRRSCHMVLNYSQNFNFSKINNFAARKASGDYLVLLNNDTEVITPDWIESMLEHAQRKEVGAVGCKLLYSDRSIQHAGVVLGMSPDRATGVAGHIFQRFRYEDPGYFGLINSVRNCSAVTAAAMMIRKEVLDEVGGFNEDLAVCYNDVDLCLRLRKMGYLIVYTPYAELYHCESLSRGCSVDLNEAQYMLTKWGHAVRSDPYYSPNLSLSTYDCRVKI
jgi:O-antigen biosynthesis protein